MSDFQLGKRDFIELYKSTIDEEHRELATHQGRVAFLTGLISALFTATFLGVTQAHTKMGFVFLSVGPILIVGLAVIGRRVTTAFYERFLSAVTMRAKLEQKLGLSVGPHLDVVTDDAYWADEAIVPARHLDSRRNPQYREVEHNGIKYSGSMAWLKAHLGTGYNKSAITLFNWAMVAAWLMLIGLLLMACVFHA